MQSDKVQSKLLLASALMIISVILVIIASNMPRVSSNSSQNQNSTDSWQSPGSELIPSGDYGSTEYSGSDQASDVPTSQSISVSYPINLNTATYEQLISIEGIGETRANAILEYRDYIGKYTSVEQLKEIKGIGDAVFEKISPYFTV